MNSITSYQTQYLSSLKQALNISMMQKAMSRDAESVQSTIKAMEAATEPGKGQHLDLKI
ncbi:putative motility protein [Fusibacter paucivorans]|uniref:Motility protein n=1 Tax=Fusibacter paucivorans TaxID=76009 RepID=A0ABS5PP10_9FIRM|nr:putative motility protein [Fusibacter paucivorans]MBS7525782.1 putative motility protein [Fusibacter paucivorans]MDK2867140.1 hypothetical protein [Clostridiales bacterium]